MSKTVTKTLRDYLLLSRKKRTKMIVIADGGSTKTNWCLINEAGRKIHFQYGRI
jgi:hypothetical protein